MTSRTAAYITLVVSLSGAPALAARTSAQVPPTATAPPAPVPAQTTGSSQSEEPARLPVDLSRIKTGLDRKPAMRLDDSEIRFTIEIIARQPNFKDFIGSYNFLDGGPVRGAQMTHQEFLNMVTPKLLNSSAGFTGTDTLQAALVNWAAQTVIKKAVTALRNARNGDEVRSIRAQIDRELAALRGGGG